jgi:hypothetical protein
MGPHLIGGWAWAYPRLAGLPGPGSPGRAPRAGLNATCRVKCRVKCAEGSSSTGVVADAGR